MKHQVLTTPAKEELSLEHDTSTTMKRHNSHAAPFHSSYYYSPYVGKIRSSA
jgi:hypothetical protein